MSKSTFASLEHEDLKDWAGPAVFRRGRGYRNRVSDLAVTEEGHIVAEVMGTGRYVTRVWMTGEGFDHECTCPYAGPCKHAVAVGLTCVDLVKSGETIPLIEAEELEIWLLEHGAGGASGETIDREKARAALEAMSKAQIVEWAMDSFVAHPGLFDSLLSASPLVDKASPLTDEALARTMARLRAQIREKASEPGWQRHWDDGGYTPDYTPVRAQLEKLLKGGQAQTVVELGEDLFQEGNRQVMASDDEGETADQIRDCMAVVLDALREIGQPVATRLIWYWDKELEDEGCLLDGLEAPVDEDELSEAEWREVAEEFEGRLASCPKPEPGGGPFAERYERQRLLHRATLALSRAGQQERAVDMMIAELPYSDNYVELVQCLMARGTYDQAADWARQGFGKTLEHLPGIAWQLLGLLIEIAGRHEDWLLVAALRVEAFVARTEIVNYTDAEQASRKAGCWNRVRQALLRFLETGKKPLSGEGWPLPDTGLQWSTPKTPKYLRRSAARFRSPFPDHNRLIEVALYEKRTEDALRWFKEAPGEGYHAEAVAEAVATTHSDVSLGIWRGRAEGLIARVKPSAYQEAMPYLSRMGRLMRGLGRGDEYRGYISGLRRLHKAKRRLMKELDELERRDAAEHRD